jgi:amino acid transporter
MDKGNPDSGRGGLSTFAGVFTPSVLTILGIILFLRLGFVVGNAGLGRALVILAMANAISVLTSVSLSTIATNLKVQGGGDYYLISRTLGAEFGGALGLVLFLAQSVSIAFYAIGFGEAVAQISGATGSGFPQMVAAGAVAALFVLAWFGADIATRFQFVVMAVLVVAIGAFFAKGIGAFDSGALRENWSPGSDMPFWVVFAIFFPAVTGFTQGVSMSGDLKDPARSLPMGTFLAVGVATLVYFGAAVIFAGTVPRETLIGDYGSMRRVAPAILVDAGVIAATLSSALASFLGAPRILQSLARDRVFPWLAPFAVGHGPTANPRRGVLLALGIAFAVIALGDLNLVAPVVSMFFLLSYGLLNYATWYESRADSPSFRPTFRWHRPWVSLVGALACLAVMVAIDAAAAIAATAVLFGVHQYLTRTASVSRWADSERSHRLRRIRTDLLAVSAELDHARDWRPVVLVFSDGSDRRRRLLRFARWVGGRSGFTTAVKVLVGAMDAGTPKRRTAAEDELRLDVVESGGDAFVATVAAADLETALPAIIQGHGLGAVRANTVLLNWSDRPPSDDPDPALPDYGEYLRLARRTDQNLILLDAREEHFEQIDSLEPESRRIDVWYLGDATGRLSLLLAYLTTRSEEWEECTIRLLSPGLDGVRMEDQEEQLRTMLADVRIAAEPVVVDSPVPGAVLDHSADASLVFLPFRLRGAALESPLGGSLADLTRTLRVTAMVLAAQDLDLDAAPEEGAHGEIAEALDAAELAVGKAEKAEKDAARAEAEAEKARARTEEDPVAPEDGTPGASGAGRVEREAEQARRRAARARAKADAAERAAQALTGDPPTKTEPEPPAD